MKMLPVIFICFIFSNTVFSQITVTELRNSVGRLELVSLLPSPTSKVTSYVKSVMTNEPPYYFQREYVSKPVIVDSLDNDNFLNLIYSDSVTQLRTRCYMPRHGIILWAKDSSYIGFIEICFECKMMQVTPSLPKPKNINQVTFDYLKFLFKAYGLIQT